MGRTSSPPIYPSRASAQTSKATNKKSGGKTKNNKQQVNHPSANANYIMNMRHSREMELYDENSRDFPFVGQRHHPDWSLSEYSVDVPADGWDSSHGHSEGLHAHIGENLGRPLPPSQAPWSTSPRPHPESRGNRWGVHHDDLDMLTLSHRERHHRDSPFPPPPRGEGLGRGEYGQPHPFGHRSYLEVDIALRMEQEAAVVDRQLYERRRLAEREINWQMEREDTLSREREFQKHVEQEQYHMAMERQAAFHRKQTTARMSRAYDADADEALRQQFSGLVMEDRYATRALGSVTPVSHRAAGYGTGGGIASFRDGGFRHQAVDDGYLDQPSAVRSLRDSYPPLSPPPSVYHGIPDLEDYDSNRAAVHTKSGDWSPKAVHDFSQLSRPGTPPHMGGFSPAEKGGLWRSNSPVQHQSSGQALGAGTARRPARGCLLTSGPLVYKEVGDGLLPDDLEFEAALTAPAYPPAVY